MKINSNLPSEQKKLGMIQSYRVSAFDFNVEPIFSTYNHMATLSNKNTCPTFEQISTYYEALVNYRLDYENNANPDLLLNLRPNLSLSEIQRVLKVFRLFYQDDYGKYHYHPLEEVW